MTNKNQVEHSDKASDKLVKNQIPNKKEDDNQEWYEQGFCGKGTPSWWEEGAGKTPTWWEDI